jgi:hypothetical protein
MSEEKLTAAQDYEQLNENIRFLADVRFKLLALVPIVGGVAVFILAQQVGLQAGDVPGVPSHLRLAVVIGFSLLGFSATLGITLYDQRNSELYNALIHRAQYLEKKFGLFPAPGGIRRCPDNTRILKGGQFAERPQKNRRIIFRAGHDLGLALIYGPLLGAWLFPISYAVASWSPDTQPDALTASLVLALIAATGFFVWLLLLDKRDKTLYHDADKADAVKDNCADNEEQPMNSDVPSSFKAYEDGKQRRYQLLFAVNGGAFAVAKLFLGQGAPYVLGNLTLRQLSIGMFLFTAVMTADIYMFGENMRKKYLPDAFGPQGKIVLILMGGLIALGWLLVAR